MYIPSVLNTKSLLPHLNLNIHRERTASVLEENNPKQAPHPIFRQT